MSGVSNVTCTIHILTGPEGIIKLIRSAIVPIPVDIVHYVLQVQNFVVDENTLYVIMLYEINPCDAGG